MTVKRTASILFAVAVGVITVGAVVLSLGSFGYQATLDDSGANIGAGIALLIGPYIVGLGLLLGLASGLLRLAARGRAEPH